MKQTIYNKKEFLIWCIQIILLISMVIIFSSFKYDSHCSSSRYNIYSNISGVDISFGDRCYTKTNTVFESDKTCGTFGISCYPDKHLENSYSYICFNTKKGGLC